MDLKSSPIASPLSGRYRPPGDKSVSHRLALLSALADGTSHIRGFLDSADTIATAVATQALGAHIEWTRTSHGFDLVVEGGGLHAPKGPLDFGNSGTGIRLMAGVLAGLGHHQAFANQSIQLTGDESLSRRPMMRIVEPLRALGSDIEATNGHAPLVVRPGQLAGQAHILKMASAQVKSAILLAGLNASGETRVTEPAPSRDHTERLLQAFGVEIDRVSETEIALVGGQTLSAGVFEVPGDISSAAFVMAAGLLVSGSEIFLEHVGLNPTRDGMLRVIEAMGGGFDVMVDPQASGEPIGTIAIKSASLKGQPIPPEWVPLAIDEFPIIMGMAALAEGETRVVGAEELRVKESDRLALMCSELGKLGVDVEETPDGAVIRGGDVKGGVVECGGDHRIAMTFAVLGLVAQHPIIIRDAHWMQTSYPGFVDDLNRLGAQLEWLA
ncbi:MAG TPA: 3-phosphoshikimate 1-carboxyvinyltransferase [Wenzhouxiangella sp.]